MDIISFRQALEVAKPSMAALQEAGLARSEAAGIVSTFDIPDRTIPGDFVLPDQTLSAVFSEGDLSRLEIGMVKFRRDPHEASGGWMIGEVEADYLMLDASSGEIVVTDVESPTHVVWRCARNGGCLLEALSVAAQYLGVCISEDLTGSLRQRDTFARCVELAGGPRYTDFYKMLLSVA